jgi:hypothetical protein
MGRKPAKTGRSAARLSCPDSSRSTVAKSAVIMWTGVRGRKQRYCLLSYGIGVNLRALICTIPASAPC